MNTTFPGNHQTLAPAAPLFPAVLARLQAAARELADALGFDRAAEFWVRAIHPLWSIQSRRARVVAIVDETADTRTYVLQPGPGFRRHLAGQFVTIALEIHGVRVRRSYSISSAPGTGPTFSITVRRHDGGRVSCFLHEHIRRGDVLEISQPGGSFVLSNDDETHRLFVAGGSGITAIMSQLRGLAGHGALSDAVLVYFERTGRQRIFVAELESLAQQHPGFRVVLCDTGETSNTSRLSQNMLAALVPDFAQRTTYVCGPPSLIEAAERVWSRLADPAKLRTERFARALQPVAPATSDAGGSGAGSVTWNKSEIRQIPHKAETLLALAERSGLRPAAGCRMGVCHTCTCRKTSGVVLDLRTGKHSNAGEQDIQICVSVAVGDVSIEL